MKNWLNGRRRAVAFTMVGYGAMTARDLCDLALRLIWRRRQAN